MAEKNFVTIKDHSTTNAIWNGAELYVWVYNPIDISGSQKAEPKIKNFQDISLGATETFADNFNKRKSYVSYGGFNNQIITLNCVYNPIKMGTTFTHSSGARTIFTPSKLYELIVKPRTVYIKDEFVIRTLLATTEGSSEAIYTDKGIPVVLQSWKITPSIEGQEVLMSLSFIEDKEI